MHYKDRIKRRVPYNNILKTIKEFYKERAYKEITKLNSLRESKLRY